MGALDMFNPTITLRLRLVVYAALIFFSFFIFVGTSVMKNKLDGKCFLYADLNGAGPESNCGYAMAMSIMLQLIYLLFRMISLGLVMLGKFSPDMVLFSDLVELVYVIVDVAAAFLIFLAACILSAGTNSTCKAYTRYIKCDNPQFPFKDSLSASRAAQAGAWISTLLWIFIAVFGFITLLRAGKIPFLSSGAAAKSDQGPAPADPNQPPIETPPNNPDDAPKY